MANEVSALSAERKPERILRWKTVNARTGIPRTSWERGMRQGIYPRPIKLAPPPSRAVGWLESDINALIERLASASSAEVPQ